MRKSLLLLMAVFSIGLLLFNNCAKKPVPLFNGKDFTGWEFVLSTDTVKAEDVWSVKEGVVHCTGVPNGYMRTTQDYNDYILTLDWRWVERESNSGVLLHAQAPYQVWPLCIECQLQAGNAGDFVLIGAGAITVNDSLYNNTGQFMVIAKMQNSNEKPVGQWNSYKIICKGDEITCFVNGTLQNSCTRASLTSGKICLQSEGAPIEFRNIRLEKL
jgi:hypothetical protein